MTEERNEEGQCIGRFPLRVCPPIYIQTVLISKSKIMNIQASMVLASAGIRLVSKKVARMPMPITPNALRIMEDLFICISFPF